MSLALMLAGAPVAAQTIAATTLGAGRSFQGTSQYLIGGTASSYQFIATPFRYTGPSGLLLDEIRLGLNTGVTRTYVVSLLRGTDVTTAATVTTWNLPVTPAAPGYALLTIGAVGEIPLLSAETYWIAVGGFGSVGGWSFGAPGVQRPVYLQDGLAGGGWRFGGTAAAPAYEVTLREAVPGTPSVVPEPATYLLMTIGLFGLTLVVRRRPSVASAAPPSAGDGIATV